MSSFNNNFSGMNLGYSFGNEEFPGFGAPSDVFESGDPIAGPSRSQDRYFNPPTEGYANQGYQESTLLGESGSQLVDPYTFQPVPTFNDSDVGEPRCCWT